MKLSNFKYQIPEQQIAQQPLKTRDASRLLVLHRKSSRTEHSSFSNIVSYLDQGDLLILNNTKVIPVRLYGTKTSGGKAEITLLKELNRNVWTALVKNVNEGTIILEQDITAQVTRLDMAVAKVTFTFPDNENADIRNCLEKIGAMPLPVYIKRESALTDLEQYQTVYAEKDGAVAAPTAGLHFTENLLRAIKAKGIEIHQITLHVGYGTFKPVKVANIADHIMDEEYFEIPDGTASAINSAMTEGRRVIAVGTTVTRALEGAVSKSSSSIIEAGAGQTSIFIYPGYKFKIIDALITNFHLPESTPMMLASAFTGLDTLKKTYAESQDKGYRFYSYGDAMLII